MVDKQSTNMVKQTRTDKKIGRQTDFRQFCRNKIKYEFEFHGGVLGPFF